MCLCVCVNVFDVGVFVLSGGIVVCVSYLFLVFLDVIKIRL